MGKNVGIFSKMGCCEWTYLDGLRRALRNMYVNEEGCWIWTGYTDRVSGYGQISVGDIRYKVHRFIAYCFHGLDIKNLKLDACHSCDVRNCINPFHIWIGTRGDNLRDAAKKGRWHNQYGNNILSTLPKKEG